MSHPEPDPIVLSAAARVTLAHVLDAIVPPSADGTMPGAGALGLADDVARALPEGLRPTVASGLTTLEARVRAHTGDGFAALAPAERADALREVDALEPGFLVGLVTATYGAYYRHPVVLRALGREARPPYPAGYAMAPFDASLLEPVRRSGKRYRPC